MAELINQSGIIYSILSGFTSDVSGSWFLTLFIIMIFFIVLSFALRIPIEYTAIIVLPLLLLLAAYVGDFKSFLGVVAILLGVILAKNFFFR
jgi:hypothetical protein